MSPNLQFFCRKSNNPHPKNSKTTTKSGPLALTQKERRTEGFDVFLSFGGSDVRKGLADHLYQTFTRAGIKKFLDSNFPRGYPIQPTLDWAIRHSRLRIPIFSSNYAESEWCLRELDLMMSTHGSSGTGFPATIPLFYDVSPSNVRHPDSEEGGPFFHYIRDHERSGIHSSEEVESWKSSLFRVSLLSGWKLSDFDGHEGKLVSTVLDDVMKALHINELYHSYPTTYEHYDEIPLTICSYV